MKLIVYSRPSCSPCNTLKYWLKSKNIPYEEREPDESVFIVPTVLIGSERIEGLNLRKLAELLQSTA